LLKLLTELPTKKINALKANTNRTQDSGANERTKEILVLQRQ